MALRAGVASKHLGCPTDLAIRVDRRRLSVTAGALTTARLKKPPRDYGQPSKGFCRGGVILGLMLSHPS